MAPKLQITVYVMKKFVYEDFLRYIQEYKATHLQVVPPILTMLDKRPETGQYDLSGVKNILCGAAPLSKELQSSLCRRFKVNIIQGWGMTELTCGAIHVPGGVYDDSGSVGRLHPNCECMLIDDEGNEITQPGTPGELCIKGPQVCLGYWKNEEATNEIMFGGADRWLKSGDIAVIKDNWFWIVDRKKELIKVNGLQVAPAELEAVLLQNDSVADAAVVRITIDGQELPRAYVALKDDRCTSLAADDIASWMSSRVAKHKQLAGGIRFVDSVPRLASGKIERKVVRQWSKRDEEMMEKRHRARL
jgi:acyl-coenzyme A synthetase/AMP-(fatty) acid ligase